MAQAFDESLVCVCFPSPEKMIEMSNYEAPFVAGRKPDEDIQQYRGVEPSRNSHQDPLPIVNQSMTENRMLCGIDQITHFVMLRNPLM